MSRYRQIHCLIWNDDKFPFLSDDCKLIYFHLLTTPLSTPFGLYKASIGALADEIRWPVKRYEKAFREALKKGFIEYDERLYVVFIPKFIKYNQPQSPNVIKSWISIFNEVPGSHLKKSFLENAERYVGTIQEGIRQGSREAFREAFREGAAKAIDIQEQEQEQEQDIYIGIVGEPFTEPPQLTHLPDKLKNSRFRPPTIEAVMAYCRERGNNIDPEKFVAHYASNGWKVGKVKMSDWKSAVITWEHNQRGGSDNGRIRTNRSDPRDSALQSKEDAEIQGALALWQAAKKSPISDTGRTTDNDDVPDFSDK